MSRIFRPAPYLAVALLVAACATGSSAPSQVASPEAAPSSVASPVATAMAPSASPAAPPTPAGSPTVFTSKTYGYSLTVPAGWTTVQAKVAWDGKGMPGHDVAGADQFISPGPASSWFFGAPTKNDLAAQVKQAIAGIATDHAECPPVPASQEPITIGGEAGVLVSHDCGILINNAITVHDGVAYVFGFRDPAIHAATYPADRAIFRGLLESVKFPS